MILLSFDTEEFDVPREHGVDFTLEEGMKVSIVGTNRILDTLKTNDVKATFFCTANFVQNAPDVMKRIQDEGHEIACHGCDHWQPKASDVKDSKARSGPSTSNPDSTNCIPLPSIWNNPRFV